MWICQQLFGLAFKYHLCSITFNFLYYTLLTCHIKKAGLKYWTFVYMVFLQEALVL